MCVWTLVMSLAERGPIINCISMKQKCQFRTRIKKLNITFFIDQMHCSNHPLVPKNNFSKPNDIRTFDFDMWPRIQSRKWNSQRNNCITLFKDFTFTHIYYKKDLLRTLGVICVHSFQLLSAVKNPESS